MSAARVTPQTCAVILRVRAPLKKNLSIVIANENRERAMQVPMSMCINLGRGTNRLIESIHQHQRLILLRHTQQGNARKGLVELDEI
jgi:hypothetical protein